VLSGAELIGHLAGVLTTFSASPQLYHAYRTRDVGSLDLWFLLMLDTGLFLWVVCGMVIGSLPVILFNFIGGSLWLPMIWMKFKETRRARDRKQAR
jgi:MtN3 and saliva related transmembrane protein